MVRKAKKIPYVLTDQERENLLKQINPRCPTGIRNLCMLRLMMNAGLRVRETLNLEIKDVNFNTGQIKVVQGKGKKDRILYVGEKDLEYLQKLREKWVIYSGPMFMTLDRKPIDDRYVRALVKRLAKKAKIANNIHPHTLRHTFATDIYRETKNIRLVQKALGHSDLSTTMIYTHVVDDELEDAMKSLRAKK